MNEQEKNFLSHNRNGRLFRTYRFLVMLLLIIGLLSITMPLYAASSAPQQAAPSVTWSQGTMSVTTERLENCFFCDIWNWLTGKVTVPRAAYSTGTDTACTGVVLWGREWAIVPGKAEKQWLNFWHPIGLCFGFSW